MMIMILLIALAIGCGGTPPPESALRSSVGDVVCGSWLEMESAGPGYVTIKVIDPHITCGTHPIKSVVVDPPVTAVFFFDSDKKRFLIAGAPGAYTVTYYEDCPPVSSVCASITVRIGP
jgi:hypothetical protein